MDGLRAVAGVVAEMRTSRKNHSYISEPFWMLCCNSGWSSNEGILSANAENDFTLVRKLFRCARDYEIILAAKVPTSKSFDRDLALVPVVGVAQKLTRIVRKGFAEKPIPSGTNLAWLVHEGVGFIEFFVHVHRLTL